MIINELPPLLERKLADFRKHVWIVKLTEGLLAAAFGLALSYVLVFVLDRLMETPAWLRASILIAGASALGLGLPLKWHRWVWSQRTLEAAAKLLRRKMPRLGDQLLGIVELARMEHGNDGRSETLVRAAMAQAADAVKNQDFSRAVPHARHRQWAWAAGGAAALVLLAFAIVNDAARNALSRWLMPWRNTERYTFARVGKLPAQLVVPYAEPFNLPLTLTQDSQWKPDSGTGRIQGQPAVNVKLNEGTYPLAFPPQKKDAVMALSVGDVRKSVKIEPRNRPELASLKVKLKLPAYLKYQSEPEIEVRSGSVNLLKDSRASFTATASKMLAEAKMDGTGQSVTGDILNSAFQPVTLSTEHKFEWKDTDGLTPREPLILKVNAVGDEAPKINARRETKEQVVLDSEVLNFDLTVADDFGIQHAGLEWNGVGDSTGEIKPAHGDKLAAAGEPEKKEMTTRATFCAEREGVPPQTLEIKAWADDFLPGRKRVYSATFVVHILNKTDHALWLTEQLGKWLQYARESYEREQQLHATNKELRSLSAAELDRPENRRRVSQQAAAEGANAERLGNLTQAGKQLVEQATKNPEFEARRLESWATMLKSLQDIAAQRMPNVSDLLKQTASAQAGKPASQQDSNAKQGQESKSAQNDNPSNQKPNGQPQESKSLQPTAPQLSKGDLPPGTQQPSPADPNAQPKPPAPSITDKESGFGKPPESQPQNPNAKPKPPGVSKLDLPMTQLAAAPGADKNDENQKPPESAAQEKMDKAVKEQRDLLAEFAKVADKLSDILGSLEASTFVKRLKAASKHQMNIASDLNSKTLNSFGLEKKDVPAAVADQSDSIAGHAKSESELVSLIQGDLEAYFQRKQDMRFKNVLDQMKTTEIVSALSRTSDRTGENLSGQSIAASEYWADTLDRWAEEMVGASDSKASSKSPSSESLPPEIVLMVMQALYDEMKLRDETREMENVRPLLPKDEYREKTAPLARKQEKIAIHTQSAADAILLLPDRGKNFGKDQQLLEAVKHVMDEAGGILDTPETGPTAIAAESEAIELLLQAKRQSSKGGGGGGGSPGGGGGAASSSLAAMSEPGSGANSDAERVHRNISQSTGHAGREFPEEFKSGLDAYFNKLEAPGGRAAMMRLRLGGIICFLAACSVLAATDTVRSEDKSVEAKAKLKLPEAVEKALADLSTEAAKIKGELRMEEMKKIITEITGVTKISDEQKKNLEAEVKPAVERSLIPWKEEFDTKLRPYLSTEGEGALAMLSQWRADQLVTSGFPGDFGKPEDDAGWKEALKKTLTLEQYGALDKIAVERERKFNEQIADYLKPIIEQTREARAGLLTNEIEDMKSLLNMPDDRVKQLEAIAEASTERACDLMRQRTTKALAAMKEQQRAQYINSGRRINSDETDEADADESSRGIWVKGVVSLLNDDERKRWETAIEERSSRNARALAMLFVAEMDQHVLFTSEQRGKLEPIAARTLAAWSKKKSNNEFMTPLQATQFSANEVKAMLDSGQWERWEAAGRGEYQGRNGFRRANNRASGEDKIEEPATQKGKLDLPDDDTLFASYFEKCLVVMRRELAAAMNAKFDDLRRVVKLPPDRSTYLAIAAKGAVEHALDARREQLDSWAHDSVQGAKGETLRKRLADLNTENLGFGDEETNNPSLWKDALAETLTAEQKNNWEAALAARETYRRHAYAWSILAELNRRYHLGNDQFQKLEPHVEKAVLEYTDDFMNMFGRGSSSMIPRYLITLFMAVPEDVSRSILNVRQWKQWNEVDSKQVAPWWESIKSNHSRHTRDK